MCDWRFGNGFTVSRLSVHCAISEQATDVRWGRGSTFLKRWMKFLEENADLRYPSMDELDLT